MYNNNNKDNIKEYIEKSEWYKIIEIILCQIMNNVFMLYLSNITFLELLRE